MVLGVVFGVCVYVCSLQTLEAGLLCVCWHALVLHTACFVLCLLENVGAGTQHLCVSLLARKSFYHSCMHAAHSPIGCAAIYDMVREPRALQVLYQNM